MRAALLASWLFLLCVGARGDGPAAPAYQVEVDPGVYPPEKFAAKGIRARSLPPRRRRPDALPDKRDRESAFDRVPGLTEDLGGLDELDRDLLYVRARTRPLADLRKTYPYIAAEKLARLKRECAK